MIFSHLVVDFQPPNGYDLSMFRRNITDSVKEALSDTAVVLLIGARQCGKSTLVQSLSGEGYDPQYLTFDDPTLLAVASEDPMAFLSSVQRPVIFDEIQRIPELLIPIKKMVDEDRQPGSFLLTGSANVLLLPTVADALVGRMEAITLRPLSQGEILGRRENFISRICGDAFALPKRTEPIDRDLLFSRILTGGFPEAVQRTTVSAKDRWFRSYIATLLQRDVRELSNIDSTADLLRLLSVLAARCGGLLNFADISRSTGIPQTTLKRYIAMFERLFVIEFLPAYSANLTKRLTRSPKLYFVDTGILANLTGATLAKLNLDSSIAGTLMENFVIGELRKQAGWSSIAASMFHFRTVNNEEVDLVVELPGGDCVGIEIKSGASVTGDAFKGLKVLKNELGPKFKRGIVLYTGEVSVAFADDLFAMPVQTLWKN